MIPPLTIAQEDGAAQVFAWFNQHVATLEGKVLYILALICIAMIVDFLVGSLAAWRSPDERFASQRGINGILRKLASILVLVCCMPVSALIPADAGLMALCVLYVGYLMMELASIVENLDRLGVNVGPLKRFIEHAADHTPSDAPNTPDNRKET